MGLSMPGLLRHWTISIRLILWTGCEHRYFSVLEARMPFARRKRSGPFSTVCPESSRSWCILHCRTRHQATFTEWAGNGWTVTWGVECRRRSMKVWKHLARRFNRVLAPHPSPALGEGDRGSLQFFEGRRLSSLYSVVRNSLSNLGKEITS